ncbi:MAG: helix-turn-helix domain-containing protein [Firmicutes bacterium]|nr:helix-turn-helix domain-containing protein [Bacillota bacterium]
MKFGRILKQLREQKELTQEQLGKIINLSKANISKYELGRLEPNMETLNQIATFFNVSIDYLLGRTDHPETIIKKTGLENIYLAVAKKMQDQQIPPEDIEKALQVVRMFKNK